MNCKKNRQNISLYLDGKLTGTDLANFEQHLSQCPDCARILAETKQAVGTVSSAAQQPLPDGFYNRLNRKLDQASEQRTPQPYFNWNNFLRGAATVAAIILVLVVVKETSHKSIVDKTLFLPSEKSESPIDKMDLKKETAKANNKAKKETKNWSSNQLDSEMKLADAGSANVPTSIGEKRISEESNKQGTELSKAQSGLTASINADENSINEYFSSGAIAESKKSAKMKTYRQAAAKPILSEWRGQNSGYAERSTKVIKDFNAWKDFWREHTSNQQSAPDLPSINFSQQMLVAVLMGQQNTGGYSIIITNVERQQNKIIVKYQETTPPPHAMSMMIITQPYHIKTIERSNLPVIFQKEK